jgi:O-antigen ligase
MLAAASRSGLIAIAAALLVYVWSLKIREIAVAIVGSAALAAGIAAVAAGGAIEGSVRGLATAVTRGLSLEDVSVAVRVQRYFAVSRVFHDHPFFGLGIGRFPPGIVVLDNEWLKALVEGGLVGLAALILFSVGGVFGIALALRRVATPRERDQVYAVGALFMGITAASYTFDILLFRQVTMIWFLSFGLLWSMSNAQDPKDQLP